MKKLGYITTIVASLFMMSGCSDFLDEELKGSLAPENTYTSTHGFEVGITGLYDYARAEWTPWAGDDDTFVHGTGSPYETLQIATDLAVTGHNDATLLTFDNLSFTAQSDPVNSFWKYGYGMVANANQILEYSEHSDVAWDKPTDKIGFQAEARFFRAYAYRYLVYLYGDVPYVDKVERDFRVDFTRTPKAEVLKYMIEDLKFAAANLPDDPDAVQPGRLTKWAALHLLSEVYLMAGMNTEAEAAAQEVIDSRKFELMKDRFGTHTKEPGDPFSDLFKENNQNRTSGNKESIWVIQLEYNTLGGGGESKDWTKRAWVPKYWDIPGFVIADSLGGRGLAQLEGLPWWIGKNSHFFDPNDMRNSQYNIKRDWWYNDPSVPELYGKKAEYTQELVDAGKLCPVITKFFYGVIDKGGDEGYGGCTKDRMKFRLSETYLLLAEALMNQNRLDEAAAAINVVRSRAHANDITGAQVNKDFLADERIRELAGEEQRRFTLSRLGLLKERILKYNTHAAPRWDDRYLLWPIPQNIIDSNTGADFPQNPGW